MEIINLMMGLFEQLYDQFLDFVAKHLHGGISDCFTAILG